MRKKFKLRYCMMLSLYFLNYIFLIVIILIFCNCIKKYNGYLMIMFKS